MKNIIRSGWNQRGPVTILYFISFLLSAFLSVKVYNILNEHIGNSLILNQMKNGFNKSAFWDILNEIRNLDNELLMQFTILLFIYLFISIILNGGLISNIIKEKRSIMDMVKDGLKYVFPFFVISIASLIILLSSLLLLWYAYYKLLGNPIEDYTTEKPFIFSLMGMIFLSFVVIGKVWGFSVLCRISYIHQRRTLRSFKEGATLLRKHIWKTLLIWFVILLTGFLFSYIFLILNASNSSTNITSLLLTIIIMQFLLWLKSFTKAIGYTALYQTVFK